MKCPICGLQNPEIAERCDCGHHFLKDELKKQKPYTDSPRSQDSRVIIAKRCLHVPVIAYLLCGLMFSVLFTKAMGDSGSLIFWIVIISLVGLSELAVLGLNKRKFWAWVLSMCLFAIYIPTPLILLGVTGIWALQTKSVRMEFGLKP